MARSTGNAEQHRYPEAPISTGSADLPTVRFLPQVGIIITRRPEGRRQPRNYVLTCDNAVSTIPPYSLGHSRTLADSGGHVNDELLTVDLDISSARTRSQLAALLRTIHLRADRPSLRTLEARTRYESTPLTKTVISEMLKGTRFPRKAVMISFLRACGVPEDRMAPWHRAWERVATNEQALAQTAMNPTSAQDNKTPDSGAGVNATRELDQAEGRDTRHAHPEPSAHSISALPDAWAKQPPDPAIQPARGGATPGPLICRRELGRLMRAL